MTDIKDMTNERLVQELLQREQDLNSAPSVDNGNERIAFANAHNEILRRMNDGWVSVEERLPEPGEDVLVFGVGIGFAGVGGVRIGTYWLAHGGNPPHWTAGEAEFKEHDAQVTHWRALPTPPKEDKQ